MMSFLVVAEEEQKATAELFLAMLHYPSAEMMRSQV